MPNRQTDLLRIGSAAAALLGAAIPGLSFAADVTVDTAASSTQTLSTGDRLTVMPGGSITVGPPSVRAVTGEASALVIDNAGNIVLSGTYTGSDKARAVSLGAGATVVNSGTISVSGSNVRAITLGAGSTLTNTGRIESSGVGGSNPAVDAPGANTTIINTGTVSTIGSTGAPILSTEAGLRFTNAGRIVTDTTSWPAVYTLGTDARVVNTGTVISTGGVRGAFEFRGTAGTLTLGRGSIVIGDILTTSPTNTLRMQVGSGMSYVYTTTGDWALQDMDGRPVVKGSAMAAGIGNAETADELLFQRTSGLAHALDLRPAAAGAGVWVAPYALQGSRGADTDDPTINRYAARQRGVVVGIPVPVASLPVEVLLHATQGGIDIDGNAQSIDQRGLYAGVHLPDFARAGALRLSGYATLGRNSYDGSRLVLVNSGTGQTTYSASYASTEVQTGLRAQAETPVRPGLDRLWTASFNVAHERIGSYSETDTFAWKARALTQASLAGAHGVRYQVNDRLGVQAMAGLAYRKLLSGGTAAYSINGTDVSFSGGRSQDTQLTLSLGARYQLAPGTLLALNLSHARSLVDGTKNTVVAARIDWEELSQLSRLALRPALETAPR